MDHNTFIGIGKNPDGPDLPLGLGMELAQNPKAMNTFGTMTNEEKASMIGYIQGAATGEEAKARVTETISRLNQNQMRF